MLSVVTWKWPPRKSYRSVYGPEVVNVLRSMVARHYPAPHRFLCVTNDAAGLEPEVEVVPDRADFAALPSPHGPASPSCYRRLRAFAPDAGEIFGLRFVSLDLDCVIVGDLRPVWDRPEDFVIWGDTNPRTRYNGSMFLLTAGARPQVWDRFDPATSPRQALAAGNHGSDQAWISYVLGKGEARWTKADGVYSYRNEILGSGAGGALPPGARVVFFHGQHDPWSPDVQQRHTWVREYWQ
jgi:hypothetical protein